MSDDKNPKKPVSSGYHKSEKVLAGLTPLGHPLTTAMPRPPGTGLAWDPAADFGFVGNSFVRAPSSTDRDTSNSQDQDPNSQSHGYQIAFVTTPEDSEDFQGENRASPPRSESKEAKAFSTPSVSPGVPLESLQYSPVLSGSTNAADDQQTRHQVVVGNPCYDVTLSSARVVESSDDNNNDDLTEERRTSRQISEASTEWEYGKKKKSVLTNSLSDWQTSGVTKSEIEYQNRKNSATSSSTGSVFMLQVEAKMRSQNNGSPPTKENIPPNRKDAALSPIRSDEFSNGRREKAGYERHRSKGGRLRVVDSDSEYPSTMCRMVEEAVKNLHGAESHAQKFDVLKAHREYHVLKMRKQLATLEKLNREMANFKISKKAPSKKCYKSYVYEVEKGKKSITIQLESDDDQSSDHEIRIPKVRHARSSKAAYRKEHTTSKDTSRSEDEKRAAALYLAEKRNFLKAGIRDSEFSGSTDNTRKTSKDSSRSEGSRKAKVYYDIRASSSSIPMGRVNNGFSDSSEERSAKVVKKDKPKPVKEKPKDPVGFFVSMFPSETETDDDKGGKKPSRNWVEKKRTGTGFYDVKGLKSLKDCFQQNNPHCYQNVRDRDDCMLSRKWDRQVNNESVLKEVLGAEVPEEEIEMYFQRFFQNGKNEDENRRLAKYWELYQQAQRIKQGNESPHAVTTKEMKERTARLRLRDPVVLNKQKVEADERRKHARRDQQRNFSNNLRRFQRMGTVNVPERLQLAPSPT